MFEHSSIAFKDGMADQFVKETNDTNYNYGITYGKYKFRVLTNLIRKVQTMEGRTIFIKKTCIFQIRSIMQYDAW